MSIDLDNVKKTIRDLLNLAGNDAAAEQEAANALHFARRLMLRHNLSEDECEPGTRNGSKNPHEVAADTEYAEATSYTQGQRLSTWENSLRHTVARLIGTVKWYFHHGAYTVKTPHGTVEYKDDGKPRVATHTSFFGPKSDTIAAAELVEQWSVTIIAMARLRFGGCFRGPGRSYCEGFVEGLASKVRAIHRAELAAPEKAAAALGEGCTALAIIESREIMKAKKARCDAWLEEKLGYKPRKSSRASSGQYHGDAYGQGRSDGSRANFSRNTTKALDG